MTVYQLFEYSGGITAEVVAELFFIINESAERVSQFFRHGVFIGVDADVSGGAGLQREGEQRLRPVL